MPTDAAVATGAGTDPRRAVRLLAVAAVLLALAMVPLGMGNFWLRVATSAVVLAGLAQSLNVMVGLAGYPALGNIVFFGVGAYATALLAADAGVPPPVAIAAGGVVAALYGLLASRAMLSLRGSYFLMATVALNAATLEFVSVAKGITHGPLGVTLPPLVVGSPETVYRTFYALFIGLLVAACIALVLVRRSRLGYGLLSIKGNEDAAEMLGVPTFPYKAVAWAISAAIAGLVGGSYAYWIGYIDPGSVFDLLLSLEVFLIVLLGGRALVLGPVIAAVGFELVGVTAWSNFQEAHLLVTGALIVLVVLFLPGGLPELTDRVSSARRRVRRASHAA
jgi:branched-chain amino acid transport system permease protein